MKRRQVLVGLGGITLGLPWLRKLSPRSAHAADGDRPRRVIVMAYPMGTYTAQWRPSAVGSGFELGTITEPLIPFADRCLFVSNCDHEVLDLGGNSYTFGHPAKKEAALTGTLLQHAFAGDGSNTIENVVESDPAGHERTPNGPSVEHFIGEFLRDASHTRRSVDLGVFGNGGARSAESSDFFFEGPANPVSVEANPAAAFADLFRGVSGEDPATDEALLALRRRNKSVLDAVRESFVDLRQGLDAVDRRVLDEHAEKIRQIELDLPPRASCEPPSGIPTDERDFDPLTMMELGDLQNRILASAMGCGLAPVGRIEYLSQQNPRFGVPLVDEASATLESWHNIVHATTDGITVDFAPRVAGFRFFVEKFAGLLAELDAIPEGDGRTVLDNSLVLLASDFGDGGGHRSNGMCFVVAGNSGPGRFGTHFDAEGYNVNHFLTTLTHMAGVTVNGEPAREFGLSGFVDGPIEALLG